MLRLSVNRVNKDIISLRYQHFSDWVEKKEGKIKHAGCGREVHRRVEWGISNNPRAAKKKKALEGL